MKTFVSLMMSVPCVYPGHAQLLPSFRYPLHAVVGAYCPPAVNAFSFNGNAASLAGITGWHSGIYSETRFLLPELTSFSAAIAMPVKTGGFALALHQAGAFNQFTTSQAGLAYAKKLGRVNLGGRFNYTAIRIPGYGSDAVFSFDIGTTWQITDKFCSGMVVSNPQGGRFGKLQGAKVPAVYAIGAGFACNDRFCISSEIIKEEGQPLSMQFALQYSIAGRFFASLGMSSSPVMPGFSFGWQRKRVRVCAAGSFHASLGFTPGIAILFMETKKLQKQ